MLERIQEARMKRKELDREIAFNFYNSNDINHDYILMIKCQNMVLYHARQQKRKQQESISERLQKNKIVLGCF